MVVVLKWTEKEVAKLLELYPTHTNSEMGTLLNRGSQSVEIKVLRLRTKGLLPKKQRYGTNRFSEEEDEIIRKYHNELTYEELAKLLNRKWPGTIEARAKRLGLQKPYSRAFVSQVEERKALQELGHVILEECYKNSPADFVVSVQNKQTSVNTKCGWKFNVTAENLDRMFDKGLPVALLFVSKDYSYWMLVERIKRQKES
jgi:hypothetical protein